MSCAAIVCTAALRSAALCVALLLVNVLGITHFCAALFSAVHFKVPSVTNNTWHRLPTVAAGSVDRALFKVHRARCIVVYYERAVVWVALTVRGCANGCAVYFNVRRAETY